MTEQIFIVAFFAIVGACFGSFANVVAIRLHSLSSLMGRSRCPACQQTLKPRHLVPIFSWLVLQGRCAECGAKIHIQYPLVELTAACLTVAAALRHSPFGPEPLAFVVEASVALGVLIMVVMDIRWKELPLEIMVTTGVIGLVYNLRGLPIFDFKALGLGIWQLILAVGVAVVIFGGQWLLSRGRWLGEGDIWFGAMMGLVLGSWQLALLAIYLAYVVGGLVVAILFLLKKVKKGMHVPFGPALATGLMLTMWYGDQMIGWMTYAF